MDTITLNIWNSHSAPEYRKNHFLAISTVMQKKTTFYDEIF